MICENKLQLDLCRLDYGAMQQLSPEGHSGLGAMEYMYLSICSNIVIILSEESNVYNVDL